MSVRTSRPLVTLKKRSEFLRLRKARTFSCRYFLMAGAERSDELQANLGQSAVDQTGVNRTGPKPVGAKGGPASHAVPESRTRFGFTVTKKIGNAVMRNRIKRRLREAVRTGAWVVPKEPFDFVVIARQASARGPFADLQDAIARGVAAISNPVDPQTPRKRRAR